MTYGKMGAEAGDYCSNPGFDNRFTTPCCYATFDGKRDTCPECGSLIECTVERQPVATCTLKDTEENHE